MKSHLSKIIFFTLLLTKVYAQKVVPGKENNLTTANIYHVVMYGQSLMLGTNSFPLLTTEQKYNSIMFSGGVRSGYDTPFETYYSGFSPLVEKVSISPAGGAKLSETPASGFSETFIELLLKENKFIYDKDKRKFKNRDLCLLISSPAQGSTSLLTLTKSETYWTRFKKDITEGKRLADSVGKIYNVPCILWNQGERDVDNKTPGEDYQQQLKDLQKKANDFIKSVTGQTNDVKLIMYQTVSHNVRKTKTYIDIANAQYQVAKTDPNITMSNTTYQLQFLKDNVHFTNIGSKLNGANHAIAAKRLLVDKLNWRSINVERIDYSKGKIILNFHVPVPPLVFDETAVTNPGNYGFSVFDNEDKPVTISSVEIMNGTSVKINVDGDVKPGWYIWYGNNGIKTGSVDGARGNLRDSQGEKIKTVINNETYRNDNWSPIFKEIIK
jgi:hypothetical protein